MPQFITVNDQNCDPAPAVFDDGTKVYLKAKRTAEMRERLSDHVLQFQVTEQDLDNEESGANLGAKVLTRTGLVMNVYLWIHHIDAPDGSDVPVTYDLVSSMEDETFDHIKAAIDERRSRRPLAKPKRKGGKGGE